MRQSSQRSLGQRAFLLAPLAVAICSAQAEPLPGGTLDPLSIPKYVTPLVIPPVMNKAPGATTSDYDIAVRQFKQQILPGGHWNAVSAACGADPTLCTLPATTVWSYGPADDPLPDSSTIAGGAVGLAPAPNSQFNYPAYTIENTSFVTTTVDWINELVADPVACKKSPDPANDAACNYIPHLLPVDRSLHWANPEQLPCIKPTKTKDCAPDPAISGKLLQEPYPGPVPMVVHVHGAHATPESDGYAEAWWLPNANNIPAGYATTGTFVNQFGVVTNDPARPGVGTFTYPNSQPSSTVWYHDHALGMTRNNVYAGPAGFWILRESDGGETGLVSGTLPGNAPAAGQAVLDLNIPGNLVRAAVREIPIAIQDRSFNTDGSLFYPDNRAFFEGLAVADLQIPFIGDPTASDIAAIWNPEAFFNTMVVNGVTWPTLEVEPDLYRFRLLNGCNSRFLNLALYVVNADGSLGDAIPFYQIGAEQSLLPKVVKIVRGDRAVLPGDGSNPPLTAAALPVFPVLPTDPPAEETVPGLLMGNAERADVIVDFRGLAQGTRVRLINTGPDEPFGGFPGPAADPVTTGQVMELMVVPNTFAGDGATPPASLVLRPVEGVDIYPVVGTPNYDPNFKRDLALLEEESILICVTIDATTNIIAYDPNAEPNPADPATCVLTGTTEPAGSVPFGPKAAVLGINGSSAVPTITLWDDPIETNPQIDTAGNPPTETWEFWNHTVDAHPIHVHEVKFKVLSREGFDPLSGALSPNTLRQPEATEAGWKDTVIAYPGEVTRIAATFDLPGLYVWHCHIVEHEDNEMMVPYCIGNKDSALGPVAPGCILNEPPVAVDDAYSTDEDIALTVPAPGVLANDTDINANNILTAVLVAGPTNGTLALNPDGSFTYTPSANFNGADSFTYKANDGLKDGNVATVSITVNPVNEPPVAGDDAFSLLQDAPLKVSAPGVLANDTDGDGNTLTAALLQSPSYGTVTLSSDGAFIYTPNAGYVGPDSFTYWAVDGVTISNEATVAITVNPNIAQMYLSLVRARGTLVGLGPNGSDLTYADEDILSWNGTNYAMVFDGSAAGLDQTADIVAFDMDPANNRILMAFGADQTVPGVAGPITVTGADIVAYDLGSKTFSLFFDGSDVSLVNPSEYLDALHLLTDGRLILSTVGDASVPSAGISIVGSDQDLLAFTPTSVGDVTKGTWKFYFDGSDVRLTTFGEGVDAASVAGNGDIYLSTRGNFNAPGVVGQNEDVFVCTPSLLGNRTACTYAPFFDGTAHGLDAENVDAIDLP